MDSPASKSKVKFFVRNLKSKPYGQSDSGSRSLTNTGLWKLSSSREIESERKEFLSTTVASFSKYRLKTLTDGEKPKSIRILSKNPNSLASLGVWTSSKQPALEKTKRDTSSGLLYRTRYEDDYLLLKKIKRNVNKAINEDAPFNNSKEAIDSSDQKMTKDSTFFSKKKPNVLVQDQKKQAKSSKKFPVQAKVPKRMKELTFRDLDYKVAIENLKSVDLTKGSNQRNVSIPN